MTGNKLGLSRLGTKRQCLACGAKYYDLNRKPPVKGGGFFTEAAPDVMLTQIHRQAQDNPIIRLSERVRSGGELALGDYGETRVIPRAEVDSAQVLGADQVLVGVNRTRRAYNQRMRDLKGFREALPVAGDRLVCLRNDRA